MFNFTTLFNNSRQKNLSEILEEWHKQHKIKPITFENFLNETYLKSKPYNVTQDNINPYKILL